MEKGIIAVDFDGTIVEHRFPFIGKEIGDAVRTLIDLQKDGWRIIIWTCRDGKYADEARDWLIEKGFTPNAVNENIEDIGELLAHKKVFASMYFDDRSFPPFPGWDIARKSFLSK